MAEKQKRKIYTSELVLYVIIALLWLTGFVFAILGVFAYNYGKLSNNGLYALQKSFAAFFGMKESVMDFRLWGTGVMLVAMIAFLIVIFVYSSKATNEVAAERRREERRRILEETDLDVSKEN